VGVSVNDYAKFGNIIATWNTNIPLYAPSAPQEFVDMNNTDYIKIVIKSVVAENVTVESITHYKNGTADKIEIFTGNIRYGYGNLTEQEPPFLICKGLTTGDKMFDNSSNPTMPIFNGTTSRSYAGTTRDVVYLELVNGTSSPTEISNTTILAYYDRASGFMCEFSYKMNASYYDLMTSSWYYLNATVYGKVVELSVVGGDGGGGGEGGVGGVGGLDTTLVIIIIVVAVIVIAVAGVLIYLKSKTKPTVPTSIPPSQPAPQTPTQIF
jgi:hypothetical protein